MIEVYGASNAIQIEKDEVRTAYLGSQGLTVLRFSNHEVMNEIEAVLSRILDLLAS